MDQKAEKKILVEYNDDEGYKVYILEKYEIVTSKDVQF